MTGNSTYGMDDYNRLMYQLQSRTYATIYFEFCFWSLLQLLVVIGNILTLKILLSDSCQRTPSNYLIASLTASDLCLSVMSNPLCHGVLLHSTWPYSEATCQYQGVASLGLVCVSISHLLLLAINRYYCVVRTSKYNFYFSTRKTLLYMVFAWVTSFSISVSYIISGQRYVFNPGKFFCYLKVDDFKFHGLVCVFYIFVPSVIIDFCYFKVYKFVNNHNNNLKKWGKSSQTLNTQDINVTKILFLTLLMYYISCTPILVIDLIDLFRQRWSLEREVYFAYTICACLHGLVNPIIYGILNPIFKKEYRKLFESCKGKLLRAGKIVPLSTKETTDISRFKVRKTLAE